MDGFSLGIAIESLVAVLLAVTIGYCVLVNRKLANLRSDQSELKKIVRDLHLATDHAAQAIMGLRESAANADESLGMQLERVKVIDKQLRESIGRGDALLAKLTAMPRAETIRAAREQEQPSRSASSPGRAGAASVSGARPQSSPSQQTVRKGPVGLGLLNAQRRAASGSGEVAA